MKKILFTASVFIFVPLIVWGAEFYLADKPLILNETIKDNFYTAGGNLNLSGAIEGDLIIAGGTVNVTGAVSGDVLVLGGTVNINGQVNQDVRIAGGNIIIGGVINGELSAAGGQIEILSGARVVRNVYLAAGRIIFNGAADDNLRIRAAEIMLGGNAQINGNFEYYSSQKAIIHNNAKINGATVFHQRTIAKSADVRRLPWLPFLTFWRLAEIFSAIILSNLIYHIWPVELSKMLALALAVPRRELARGFTLFFIIPIGIVIFSLTLIGIPLAIIAIFGYAALIILGIAACSLLAAAIIAKFIFNKDETELTWWLISLGALTIGLIKIIPYVGWIIVFLLYLTAFGALGNKLYHKLLPQEK